MVEISNNEELETWLMDKPIEWSQVLAARISLRMLPLIIVGFEKGKPFSEDQLKWILSSFRATFISWAARRYPAHDMVSISARAAAYTTATTPTTISPRAVANAAVTTISATSAHIAAARAANVTITVSATATNAIATNAARATAYAAAAANAAATAHIAHIAAAISPRAVANATRAIWGLINTDCEILMGYVSSKSAAQRLATENLWVAGLEKSPYLDWFSEALISLEQAMYENDDNWHVWIDWYRPVLQSRPCWELRPVNAEKLTVRIANQNEKFWGKGVNVVNAQIADWLEDFNREEVGQRRAIKQEVSSLRQAIADTNPVHGGIGHNDPPEGFELSAELTNQVEQAIDVIDTEMDKAEPSVEALTHSVSALKATFLWAAKKADLGADAFVTQLGKVGAIAAAGLLLPIEWQKVYVGIGSVLEKILQWLSIGTPPI